MSFEKALRMINVPETHWNASLDCCDDLPHYEPLKKFHDNLRSNVLSGNSLVLFGDYSRGKSAIAAIMLRDALKLGLIGYWLKMSTWAKMQIEKVVFDATYGITVEEHCATCKLLVLDELVIREQIKYNEQAIEQLIRGRADDKLATIVTTNLSWRKLESEYPATAAAMVGVYKWVEVAGYDFRADREGRRNAGQVG